MIALGRTHVKKTRKPHSCWGCAQSFPKGSTLVKIVSVDDVIYSSYWCSVCDAYYQTLDSYAQEDGIMFGDFAGEPDYLKFKENYEQAKARIT